MTQTSNELAVREKQLEEFGYNVVNIHADLVRFDLMTDSWTEILTQPLLERMRDLQSQIDYEDRVNHTAEVFPFEHFINVAQGRAAEAFFWKVGGKKDKQVITNILFPTTRQHIVMNRMTPLECPVSHVFDAATTDVFRGNLDCSRLRECLLDDAGSVGYVYIEAENNASGGYAVSMSNLKEIRKIISDYDIKMVLDGTRLVENCIMIQSYEDGYQNRTVLDILHEFCSYFDSMTCSLAKDYGINRGGIIATNDERLFYRAKDTVSFFGPGINATDKAMINAAMQGWGFVESMARNRVAQAKTIHAALTDNGLPVISPSAGHCVLLDVEQYMDVSLYKNPVTAFIAYIYAQTGIRGGLHVSGMMKVNCKSSYVRFALPLCMPDSDIDTMLDAFVDALKNIPKLADMEKTSSIPGLTGLLNARYKPLPLTTEVCANKTSALA